VSIGLTDEQRSLADSLADWAKGGAMTDVVRAAESDRTAQFEETWRQLTALDVPTIAVPEHLGGAGGSLVDLACALEACAYGLAPGPLLSTAVAATLLAEHPKSRTAQQALSRIADGSMSVALAADLAELVASGDGKRLSGRVAVVWDAGTTTHVLLGTRASGAEEWLLLDARAPDVVVEPAKRTDLSRGVGSVRLVDVDIDCEERLAMDVDHVRAVAVTLAAAEASGIARWALDTAVGYAKVREQFGQKIGAFQAIKHLCAQMLESSESATAVAWDAASAYSDGPEQARLAAAVAGAVALEAAVVNTKDCIQVLGGIGFTWEHDAHLYLRRALTVRQLLGGSDSWRIRVAQLAMAGHRRAVRIDVDEAAEQVRQRVREQLQKVVEQPATERRTALAEAGLIAPHWPEPYGLGAGPAEQIAVEEELAAAGVVRPELAIGAWAAPTILAHGTEHQRERFVGATLRGEITWCQLFSEPGAGSDLASLRTRAERVDGGWRITGQKVWTSLAAEADWAICLARTNPDAPRHKGITYFLVDMRTDGIEVRPLRELTGEAVFNEVFLVGVFVPDDCVVGKVDGGWMLARTTLANERVAMSGSSLGVSVERALATVAGRGNVSEAVLLRLGAAVAESTTVTLLGVRSTLRSIAGQGPGAESSVQKLVGVRHRQEAAQLAFDLLGGDALLGGDIADQVVHELFLTRCLSIAGGTTQVLRNVASERILGLPREER
jgi:alkylation response protein AidB-like acyl-CoA dehydrogenase